jgi:TrmH family RNA methyltransferase
MITSTKNPKVQWVRALQGRVKARRDSGVFVVEGVRLVEEALKAGWGAQLVFISPGLSERGLRVAEGLRLSGAALEEVDPAVMRSVSDTQTPQGILAVLPMSPQPLPDEADFIFVPDQVRDPGNLGAILRTAAAAGVDGVFLPPGTVDAFAPKVMRAGMGAHFRLPLIPADFEHIRAEIALRELHVYLAAAGEGIPYTQADFRPPLALIVGGEAAGAGQTAEALSARRVHIPMPGGMESLNAAIAAAVLLFEVVRQRST